MIPTGRLLAATLTALCAAPAAAQPVSPAAELGIYFSKVSADGVPRAGAGLTRLRGRDCFVVLPYHVNAPDTTSSYGDPYLRFPGEIQGARGRRTRATYEYGDPDKDWAILRVERGGEDICARWPDANAARTALQRGSNAVVIWRTEGGNLEQFTAEITGRAEEFITLRPRSDREQINKGLSGSRVEVNGVVVAIVRSVAEDGESATAQRIDFLTQQTRRFFDRPEPPPGGALALSVVAPGASHFHTHRGSSGMVWLVLAAGASSAAYAYHRDVERVRGAFDANGVWQEYPSVEREYPARRFWWRIWLAGGAVSALEAWATGQRHAREPGPRPSRGRAVSPPRVDVTPDGAVSVGLVEVRF
ncbi:MAG TPA: hypothetical protein VFY65_16785 [Longimicrobium sp.]|nr:hypothetical protein [Longimicrobium sp.]